MKELRSKVLLLAATMAACVTTAHAESIADNWHQWRGPEHTGVSRTAKPPLKWSENSNVQWKVAIQGNGSSAPIIWNDKVFVLTAVNTGRVDPSLPRPEDQPKRVFDITHPNTAYAFLVHCLDRNTGREIWRRMATEMIPHEGHHKDNNFASASPITDGERIYCWFGSAGLFCYDLEGNPLWQRNLGKVRMGASLGEGTSPALHDGKLVIVRDHQQQSHIETLDAKTGKTLWRKNRDERNTWATAAIVEHSGRTQVITPGSNKIRSYDLQTGEVIWQCGGLTSNPIPCPLIDGDRVICMTGYKGHSVLAIDLDSRGDVTGSDKVVWSRKRGTPYIPSPLLYDGLVYFNQSNQQMWTCLDAKSGELHVDRERLAGIYNIYSSPVGAAGRIYVTGRNGTSLVLQHGKEFKVLTTNKLDDSFNSSPALAGDQLFLRGRKFLYCLSNKGGNKKPTLQTLQRIDVTELPKLTAKPVRKTKGRNAALLAKIDASSMPLDYPGGTGHQPWVDGWMKKFSEEQRALLGKLWAEKRRTDPEMPNKGMSFIKILKHVRENGNTQPARQQPVVSGTVRFEGKLPRRHGINMTPESARLYEKPPLKENILADKNGGLANVFVYAKRGVERKKYPMPGKPALLDQAKSMFRPRIQGVRVGQNFIIRNSDPYIHNTRSLSLRNRAFNIGQPPKSTDRERVFKRAEGPIRLGCDFHKWMAAWIFVLDHPFFAVTDENGNFEIKGLPSGDYTFEAWHEEFGDQRITLKVDGSAKLAFTYQPGDK